MLTNNTVILAKIESTYGTDPIPTIVNDALLVKDVEIKPSGDTVRRDFIKRSLSPLPFVRGLREVQVDFKTELKGPGSAGVIPAYGWEGVLFRSCGMSETIGVGTQIEYKPISTGFESCTLYVFKDSIKHKVLGCRGTWKIIGECGKYGEVQWSFRGLYSAPVDLGLSNNPIFNAVSPPVLLSAGLTIGGFAPVAEKLEIDFNNSLASRKDINSATGVKEQLITGRDPQGSFDPEAVTEATKPFWNLWEAATTQALNIGPVGATAGNIITITAPKMQFRDVSYADRNGLLAYQIPFNLAMTTGDDELSIVFT